MNAYWLFLTIVSLVLAVLVLAPEWPRWRRGAVRLLAHYHDFQARRYDEEAGRRCREAEEYRDEADEFESEAYQFQNRARRARLCAIALRAKARS
jgi:hypothetical protein